MIFAEILIRLVGLLCLVVNMGVLIYRGEEVALLIVGGTIGAIVSLRG